jgi:Ca-activated chloride channel family protein
MFSISEKSGGKPYFAQEPEEISKIFADEMKSVQSIVAKKLEFVLRLTTGVEVRNIYRVKPSIAQITGATVINRAVSLSFLEIEADSTQSILIELLLPPKKEGTYRIAQTEMSSDLPTGSDLSEKVRGDVVVNYTNSPTSTQLNPDVMNIVERVNAFRLQNKAMEDIKSGNVTGATQKLRSVATRLLELGETELAEAANQEANNLESQGEMSNLGTKKLQYGTRKLGPG